MNKKRWTNEEIEILNINYPAKQSKELISLLNGRDIWSIRNKARNLGLHKNREVILRTNKISGIISSKRMTENNPMKNKENIERMRVSQINRFKKLRENTKDDFKGCIRLRKIPFSDEQKNLIIDMYAKGFTLSYIGNAMGFATNTIKRRMIDWGISRRTECKYSTFHKSDDGHIVKSSMELIADNWLFNNGIFHIYEKRLGETRFLCDFYIPESNTYIEIFGLTEKSYKDRFERKLKVYSEMGLINNLVIILPKDKIEEKLNFLMQFSKIQQSLEI